MEQNQKFLVYKYINKINNKIYIEQTKNLKKRCTPGNYKGSPYFYHAIKKYGWQNFEQEILAQNLSQQKANELEIFYIKYFNSTNLNFGYNIADGGALQRSYSGQNNPFYGKHHTEYIRKKLSEQHKHIRTKPVLCITTGQVFESALAASEWCHISKQNIQRCCKGGRSTAGKHPDTKEALKWRYAESGI